MKFYSTCTLAVPNGTNLTREVRTSIHASNKCRPATMSHSACERPYVARKGGWSIVQVGDILEHDFQSANTRQSRRRARWIPDENSYIALGFEHTYENAPGLTVAKIQNLHMHRFNQFRVSAYISFERYWRQKVCWNPRSSSGGIPGQYNSACRLFKAFHNTTLHVGSSKRFMRSFSEWLSRLGMEYPRLPV
jgi:hypothetical protein